MLIFRGALCVAWLVMVFVTIRAVTEMGLDASSYTAFFGDFHHPWRAQYNSDSLCHILLVTTWVAYREKGPLRSAGFAFAVLLAGGLFSLAYIFVQTFTCEGSIQRLLVGHRAVPSR